MWHQGLGRKCRPVSPSASLTRDPSNGGSWSPGPEIHERYLSSLWSLQWPLYTKVSVYTVHSRCRFCVPEIGSGLSTGSSRDLSQQVATLRDDRFSGDQHPFRGFDDSHTLRVMPLAPVQKGNDHAGFREYRLHRPNPSSRFSSEPRSGRPEQNRPIPTTFLWTIFYFNVLHAMFLAHFFALYSLYGKLSPQNACCKQEGYCLA